MRVGALLGESLRDQLGVRQDDGEQVVEVVGNPAGELADRFHLLGLAQLLLEGAPLGDVFGNRLEAFDPPIAPSHRAAGEPHQDAPAVLPFPRDFRPTDRVAAVEPSEDALALLESAYTSRAMSRASSSASVSYP